METTLRLTDLFAAWRQGWRVLLAGSAAGALVGIAAWLVIPAPYEAVTVVQVESAEPQQLDMAAEEAIASSRRVTAEALDALADPHLTITALESAGSAQAVRESGVLHVTFGSRSPLAAARGADALAQAYLAARAVDASRRDVAVPAAHVVDPARVPLSRSGPGRLAWWLGGTTLGALVAAAIVTSRSRAARAS
ncbi:hypothetical protein [Aeromicrobium sp. CF3.5]|uniref:hypothetical protein n=1 Tax=Aeromicrobium sp. CF3.5 TaxID=3373078 RepID=UPI003EE50358